MKLFFLSSDFVPQHLNLLKHLISEYNAEVHSIHISASFTYVPENVNNLFTYKKSNYRRKEMIELIIKNRPSLLYVAGYFDKDFLWLAKQTKKMLKIPVVVGSDTQWRGTLKQRLGILLSRAYILPHFTHIWIAGVYQYEWARKLGFRKDQIIFDLYSGNSRLFESVDLIKKEKQYPHNFIYVGRFVKEKGLDYLIEAWLKLKDKKGWTLTLIGEGYLKEKLVGEGIIVKDYMTQDLLIDEINKSGCFILPSVFEPWALVIHEFASAGLPILCTTNCGAAPHFVINNFNGYTFPPFSTIELTNVIEKIILKKDNELMEMSKNSRKLGARITQEFSSASLMSIIQ